MIIILICKYCRYKGYLKIEEFLILIIDFCISTDIAKDSSFGLLIELMLIILS